ncbi:unnamed protein product [Phyllotreta striolata]|uniref:Major facilitator superfamily (MFS) profile domain-containing protein n=1 Tax=Phyllotreta striolata TaxID=444603 RepID=A0A9N9TVQ6_PHYSR|nr:unnamed protein product [Phyllotreta striolata]
MASNGPFAQFKSRLCQYSIACTVNLAALSISISHIWPIFAIHDLDSGSYGYKLKHTEISWLLFAYSVVSAIGTVLAALIINQIGRKNLILMTATPLTVSWILLATGNNKIYVFIATAIAAVMSGALFTAVPVYLAEIAEAKIRGFLVGTFAATQSYGTILVTLLLPYATTDSSMLAYISSTFTVIMAVLLVFLPESPYQFMLHGNHALAVNNLSKLRRKRDVTEEMDRIRQGMEQDGRQRSIIYLFKNRTYLKCLLISLLVVLTQVLSGSMEAFSYSVMAFQDASSWSNYSRIVILVFTVILYLTPLFTLFLSDRVGRRPLLLLAVGTIAISQLPNGIILLIKDYFVDEHSAILEYLQLVPLYTCSIAYYGVVNMIRMILTAEIFPSNIIGAALCMINSFSIIAFVLFSFLKSFLVYWLGMYVVFFIGSLSSFVGFCLLFKFLPETKLKTMEKIQEELRCCRRNVGYVIRGKVEEVESNF